MLVRKNSTLRPGATTVEMAVIAPVFILFVFGLLVLGLGVFRYNQMSYLAREAARYAVVRGIDYGREVHIAPATQDSIHTNAVLTKAAGLDRSKLTTTVTWDRSNAPRYYDAITDKTTINYVQVTVSYQWFPETILTGPITLSSTSRMPMSY